MSTLLADLSLLQDIMPWVIVAMAVGMLVFIICKCVSIYRNLKKNRTYVKHDGEHAGQDEPHTQEEWITKDEQDVEENGKNI